MFRPLRADVPIAFDPTTTPLVPGGQIKFPIVAGAPPEGIICQLPNSWTSRQRSLVFRLKLSKSGATANEVTINSVLYRQMTYTSEDDEAIVARTAARHLRMAITTRISPSSIVTISSPCSCPI